MSEAGASSSGPPHSLRVASLTHCVTPTLAACTSLHPSRPASRRVAPSPPSCPSPRLQGRRVWLEEEDRTILDTVREIGFRWRTIASYLPGRSDDAVRNRWNRLQACSATAQRLAA